MKKLLLPIIAIAIATTSQAERFIWGSNLSYDESAPNKVLVETFSGRDAPPVGSYLGGFFNDYGSGHYPFDLYISPGPNGLGVGTDCVGWGDIGMLFEFADFNCDGEIRVIGIDTHCDKSYELQQVMLTEIYINNGQWGYYESYYEIIDLNNYIELPVSIPFNKGDTITIQINALGYGINNSGFYISTIDAYGTIDR